MVVEPFVLDRHNRMLHMQRHFFEILPDAVGSLHALLFNELAGSAVLHIHDARLVFHQHIKGGHIIPVPEIGKHIHHHHAADNTGGDRPHQYDGREAFENGRKDLQRDLYRPLAAKSLPFGGQLRKHAVIPPLSQSDSTAARTAAFPIL